VGGYAPRALEDTRAIFYMRAYQIRIYLASWQRYATRRIRSMIIAHLYAVTRLAEVSVVCNACEPKPARALLNHADFPERLQIFDHEVGGDGAVLRG
jgi:hypothetical protein